VTIGPDTGIRPHTVIESSVSIGKRCTIGPFARLRTGVTLADDIRIGNFAELVRTKVGPRVRINHVSYLGDATVEEEVNIGAGTITANYDGKARHPTRIGKGAFIGCDTVLIAPVNVGPGAITGAGSVVTRAHDVPPKGVVVGVPARAMTPSAEKDGAVHVRPAKPSRPTPSALRGAPVRSTRSPKRPSLTGHHAARATRRHQRARR
jgi:bifunctional UDP-N-acetylglucosamine pyrophosphorylase/glucosamine-1-phosphate N-acetyltransferase